MSRITRTPITSHRTLEASVAMMMVRTVLKRAAILGVFGTASAVATNRVARWTLV